MSVDLVKYWDRFAAVFPDHSFYDWMKDHFEWVKVEEGARPHLACRRCGMAPIFGLTKHAHNVHGDDLPVLHHPTHENSSDEQGRPVSV